MRVVRLVYSDELMADQVVTCCKCGRDSDRGIQSVKDGITCPDTSVLRARDEALLEDLNCMVVTLANRVLNEAGYTYTRLYLLHQSYHKIRGT